MTPEGARVEPGREHLTAREWHWLHAVALVVLVGGVVGAFLLWIHVGLVGSSGGDCTHPVGAPLTPCFARGHPYIVRGILVLVGAIFSSAALWSAANNRSVGHLSDDHRSARSMHPVPPEDKRRGSRDSDSEDLGEDGRLQSRGG